MRRHLGPLVLVSILTACGSDPPPAPVAPPPPPAPVAVAPPAPVEPPKAPEPTAEEKKKAADLKELQDDRAKFEADNKAELARWTPEMHAAAKALADKSYPTGHAAIVAAAASKNRRPGDADRDKYRHPAETLDALGFKPTMKVLEWGPGEGWYTELLAPALAKNGKLYVTSGDPNGPPDARSTLGGQKIKAFLETSPELYGKVEPVIIADPKAPKLGADASLDMVLVMRGLHGMHNGHTMGAWLAEFNRVLKPGGILGIEEHRANPDSNPDDFSKKGYVPEKWAIDQIEAAGFKLAGKSEVNANAKDTKDHPEGVWTLPPTFRLKDKDHDKYAAIGESDRMTLKFVKVVPKAAPAAKPATPAAAKPATPATPATPGTKPATPATPAPKK